MFCSFRCVQTLKRHLGDVLSSLSPLLGLHLVSGQLMPRRLYRKMAGSLVPRAAPTLVKRSSAKWQSHVLVTDTKARWRASYPEHEETNSEEMRCRRTQESSCCLKHPSSAVCAAARIKRQAAKTAGSTLSKKAVVRCL